MKKKKKQTITLTHCNGYWKIWDAMLEDMEAKRKAENNKIEKKMKKMAEMVPKIGTNYRLSAGNSLILYPAPCSYHKADDYVYSGDGTEVQEVEAKEVCLLVAVQPGTVYQNRTWVEKVTFYKLLVGMKIGWVCLSANDVGFSDIGTFLENFIEVKEKKVPA